MRDANTNVIQINSSKQAQAERRFNIYIGSSSAGWQMNDANSNSNSGTRDVASEQQTRPNSLYAIRVLGALVQAGADTNMLAHTQRRTHLGRQ